MPTDLKEFISSYTKNNEIFDLQERHDSDKHRIKKLTKISLPLCYTVDIFMFISAIILLLATSITMYLLCKHKKIRALIASLVLQQVKSRCRNETNQF